MSAEAHPRTRGRRYTRNLPAVEELSKYLNVNVAGVISLTSQFLRTFQSSMSRAVINISSLGAVQPFKSWAMYCSGKAARDMFFSVLAGEEEDVRVLNYAPGPLQTDMSNLLVESEDEGVRTWAKQAKAENQLLSCDTSVNKLIQILEKDSFKSGAHIDFYDEI
nr:hypothetical protein BaRGS_027557 [Batillaria attramentaria]